MPEARSQEDEASSARTGRRTARCRRTPISTDPRETSVAYIRAQLCEFAQSTFFPSPELVRNSDAIALEMNRLELPRSASMDLDAAMPSDAELEAILRDAEALGAMQGGSRSGLLDTLAPSSHLDPALFDGSDAMLDDIQQLQNQLLALQPSKQPPSPRPSAAELSRPRVSDGFLAPPRQTYGAQSSANGQLSTALGGIWAGKVSTLQGPFADVVVRMLVTKERPNVAVED